MLLRAGHCGNWHGIDEPFDGLIIPLTGRSMIFEVYGVYGTNLEVQPSHEVGRIGHFVTQFGQLGQPLIG